VSRDPTRADRYEFSRPQDDLEVQTDGTILPQRRSILRRERPDGSWEDLGWILVRLSPLRDPPPGHAPVTVSLDVSVNLAVPDPGRGPAPR